MMHIQYENINTVYFLYRRLEKEKTDILKTKNQMALDLERLLNQREVKFHLISFYGHWCKII